MSQGYWANGPDNLWGLPVCPDEPHGDLAKKKPYDSCLERFLLNRSTGGAV